MAIHTFSTKTKDDESIEEIKQYCKHKGINFSLVVVRALLESKIYEQARAGRRNQSTANK